MGNPSKTLVNEDFKVFVFIKIFNILMIKFHYRKVRDVFPPPDHDAIILFMVQVEIQFEIICSLLDLF